MTTHDHARNHAVALAAPAEDLCLAFANTRYWRGKDEPTETLSSYGDLLTWLEKNSGSAPALLSRAKRWATDHDAAAGHAATEAVAVRETIYRLFTAVAAGDKVGDRELADLNRVLAEAPPRERLIRGEAGLGWAANPDTPGLPALLASILWSAADLLTHATDRRVRRCANDACLWLFMDHSKGGTRRWCDMNACGNRAKAKRHYLRSKRD
jgi:predicted RNA-binding Zn ribbon-like protein